MKKIFAIAAIAAITLTSCVKNEEAFEPQQEIGFTTVAQKPTKATGIISGTTYPTTEHFGAYSFFATAAWNASNAATAYMEGAEIQLESSVWHSVSPKYYWPISGNLTFACFSPYTEATAQSTVSATYTTGVKFTNYTNSTDAAAQVDLSVTELIKDATPKVNVPAVFNHTLSQIVFTGKTTETYASPVEIKITGITMNDVNTKGTYASTNGTYASGAWSALGTPADYAVVAADAVLNATAAQVGSTFLVIPQGSIVIDVDYTVTLKAGVSSSATKQYTIAAAWEKGKKYTYNIAIGLNEILFTPTVTDWTAETGVNLVY